MPVIRKITRVGGSKGITIPKSWLVFAEKEAGQRITEVALEINGSILITPIISKENLSAVTKNEAE